MQLSHIGMPTQVDVDQLLYNDCILQAKLLLYSPICKASSLRYTAILHKVCSWDMYSPSQLYTWFWQTQTSAGSQRHGTGPQASECTPHLQSRSQRKTPVFRMCMPPLMKQQHYYSECILGIEEYFSSSEVDLCKHSTDCHETGNAVAYPWQSHHQWRLPPACSSCSSCPWHSWDTPRSS